MRFKTTILLLLFKVSGLAMISYLFNAQGKTCDETGAIKS